MKLLRLLALGGLLVWGVSLLIPVAPSYAEEGKATWYGPGFHGRRMANGQIFDMYDPTTTACNIYPFGTWLKVTNPANGRSVVVQVRDRGAFRHALDLSYAAFRALDDTGKSVLTVRYEVVSGPEGQPVSTPVPTLTPRPQPTATSTPTPTPAPKVEHVVEPGDTLWDIAGQYGLTVDDLLALNSLDDADLLVVGQRLRVSLGSVRSEDGSAPAVGPRDLSATSYWHTVVEGDTLWGIAIRYGLTVDELLRLNDLDEDDYLSIGQKLHVSGQYEVKPGDTLSAIAARHGVTVFALMTANGLQNGDLIRPGTLLVIPES